MQRMRLAAANRLLSGMSALGLAALAVLPLVGSTCNSGDRTAAGEGAPLPEATPEPGKSYHGRITSVVTGLTTAEILAALTAQDIQTLTADGIRVQNDPPALVSSELPLQGHWVQFGSARYMTDAEGRFTIDALPEGAADGEVYSQLSGQSAEGTFPLTKLRPTDTAPETVVIALSYALPTSNSMDGHDSSAAKGRSGKDAPDGCPLRNCEPVNKPMNCCLDYDNPSRDGLPRSRGIIEGTVEPDNPPGTPSKDCNQKAYLNFLGSTCFRWTYTLPGRPCSNEGAVNPVTGGPSCVFNHKYRYCQEMDISGFVLSREPGFEARFGQRIRIRLRNATAANETFLRFGEDNAGKLELAPAEGTAPFLRNANGGYVLEHYSDTLQEHYDEVDVDYIAPDAIPTQPCQRVVHLVAQASGQTRELEIRIGQQLEMVPGGTSLAIGGTAAFKVQAIYQGLAAFEGSTQDLPAGDFEWSSSAPGVAAVSGDGTVTAIDGGAALITAQSRKCDARATGTVTVRPKDEPPPPGPGGGAGLTGEWLGNFAYLDGTRYAIVINFSTGTVAGKEVPIPNPIPPASELRAGPLFGTITGGVAGGAFNFAITGAWDLTLTGEEIPPEDPNFQRQLLGTLKINNDPNLPQDAPYHGFWSFGTPVR